MTSSFPLPDDARVWQASPDLNGIAPWMVLASSTVSMGDDMTEQPGVQLSLRMAHPLAGSPGAHLLVTNMMCGSDEAEELLQCFVEAMNYAHGHELGGGLRVSKERPVAVVHNDVVAALGAIAAQEASPGQRTDALAQLVEPALRVLLGWVPDATPEGDPDWLPDDQGRAVMGAALDALQMVQQRIEAGLAAADANERRSEASGG